jgi:serine/threonine protein kinase
VRSFDARQAARRLRITGAAEGRESSESDGETEELLHGGDCHFSNCPANGDTSRHPRNHGYSHDEQRLVRTRVSTPVSTPRAAARTFSFGSKMEVGQRINDRYQVERVLGEGGSAVVWAAHDHESGEPVAVKLLKEAHIERRLRFTREARAAMAITHPSVVRIRDVGNDGDMPYLVMDLLRGETLAQRLSREGALPVSTFANLFARVISAVGAAHGLGIVHRDLKPANIFLLPDDEVRVLDFGLAKLTTSNEPSSVTETGDRLGTPRYMSPEQVQGRRDVDHRSDVWSLGILFHESLTGEHPLPRETVAQTFGRITRGDLPRIEKSSVPSDLVELTQRMLSRDRGARPELAEVLEVVRRHAEIVVDELPERRALQRTASQEMWRHEPTADETGYPPHKQARRFPLLWAAILIVLATAAVVAWVVRQ